MPKHNWIVFTGALISFTAALPARGQKGVGEGTVVHVCCLNMMALLASPWSLQPAANTLDLTAFHPPSQIRTTGWGGGVLRSSEGGSSSALVPFDVTPYWIGKTIRMFKRC
jgi:hypothetical protein